MNDLVPQNVGRQNFSTLEIMLLENAQTEGNFNVAESLYWNELVSRLNGTDDFLEFFVAVRKAALKMTAYDLNNFSKILDVFLPKFGSSAIVYLKDTIDADFALQESKSINYTEKKMVDAIVEEFPKVFPNYKLVAREFLLPTIGRIDLLAKDNDRFVIIEVKSGNKTPNTQLFSYSTAFTNPILIGITEKPLSKLQKNEKIHYYEFG